MYVLNNGCFVAGGGIHQQPWFQVPHAGRSGGQNVCVGHACCQGRGNHRRETETAIF